MTTGRWRGSGTAPRASCTGLELSKPFSFLSNIIFKKENKRHIYIEKEKKSIDDDLPSNWSEVKSQNAGLVQFGLYNILRSSK
jgi:hypothetical protein